MSGLTSLTLTTCGADVRRRRAEADLPNARHQAGPANGSVLTEQRTTRCDGQALMASACHALFFSISAGAVRELSRDPWPAAPANCAGPAAVNWRRLHAIGDN